MVGVAHMYCDAWIPVYFVAHAGSNFVIGEQFGSNLLGPARGGAIDRLVNVFLKACFRLPARVKCSTCGKLRKAIRVGWRSKEATRREWPTMVTHVRLVATAIGSQAESRGTTPSLALRTPSPAPSPPARTHPRRAQGLSTGSSHGDPGRQGLQGS